MMLLEKSRDYFSHNVLCMISNGVIYSIATKIGGPGLGLTSYNTVKALFDAGFLKKAVCYGNKSDIEKRKLLVLRGNPAKLLFFLPNHYYRSFRKGFLDYITSKVILKTGCDVFHGWNHQALRSIKAAKKIKASVIIESGSIHRFFKEEILNEEYKRFGLEIKKCPAYTIKASLEELLLADYIFLISEFAKATYIKAGFDDKKLFVMGRGVELSKFAPDKVKKDKFRVLFVGRICIRKGVQYLLEAWKGLNLKNAELLLVGNIEDNFKSILSKYNDIENIVFTGFLKKPEEAYKKSIIFVFPSLEEGGAKVTYEAMAAGLPQITTENSASVVRNGIDGFIIPIRDSNAIKEKILHFYENPESVERMSANALENIKNYSWEDYRNRLIDTYKKLFHL